MNAPTEVVVRQGAEIVQADAASVLAVIARAASDPNTDVDKLERLMAMQERLVARQAEQAFAEAMSLAQAVMPAVLRNKTNSQTNSTYSNLEQVDKTIRPVMTEHGFSMSFGTDASPLEHHYRITCIVSHSGGHSRLYHADIPNDIAGIKGSQNKTPTHAFGSSMSYGRRYLTLLIFNVATTDDDGNAAGSVYLSDEDLMDLEADIAATYANPDGFLKWLGVDSLASLPKARLLEARNALAEVRRQKSKGK